MPGFFQPSPPMVVLQPVLWVVLLFAFTLEQQEVQMDSEMACAVLWQLPLHYKIRKYYPSTSEAHA